MNGTDPKFLAQLNASEPEKAAETEASRFRDMNQLKYAIRSFQKYAPWVRDIILLTNGQGIMFFNFQDCDKFGNRFSSSCSSCKYGIIKVGVIHWLPKNFQIVPA